MFLFVGLGNDSNKYLNTRHNIGFKALDKIINEYSIKYEKTKFQSHLYTGIINTKKTILIKPTTMMNLSGIAVSKTKKYYKIPNNNIIIFHDDLDIEVGKIKIKYGGGSGGHNGIRSLDQYIGNDYFRLRIGIGHPGNKDLVEGYVLTNFKEQEKQIIDKLLINISENISLIMNQKKDKFLSKLNI